MALKPICKKCIHDFGDGCEAFRDEYMRIYDKGRCDDFNDGTCQLFLLNLLMEKMNKQKNGTDLLCYGIV